MDSKFKREVMLEHYQKPINKGLIEDVTYKKINTKNESCVDNVDIMLKIENNKIIDIRFDGEACAISTSATSIMIKTLIGKTINEVKNIIINYERMINEEEYVAEVLEELNVYDEIYKQPSRKRCALLPFKAIKKALEEEKKEELEVI
jgi:nitrogen fixation NifU-like protein